MHLLKQWTSRRGLYLLLSVLAPLPASALLVALVAGAYGLALANALAVVALMEGRVQVGGRPPHGPVFWVHLVSALFFFIALVVLLVHPLPQLAVCTAAAALLMLGAGMVLWYRGLRAVFSA